MKKVNKNGSESPIKNNTQQEETVNSVSSENQSVKINPVLIQLNFKNDDYGFKKTTELVVEVEHLNVEINWVRKEESKEPELRRRVYGDVRYFAINPLLDTYEMVHCFTFFICCFPEFQTFLKEHPEGGFKVVAEIDLVHPENQEMEFVSFQSLSETDLNKLRLLDRSGRYMDMTLESKLQFLSTEETEVLIRCLTTISRGEHICLYSRTHLSDQFDGDTECLKQFILAYNKLKDLYLAELVLINPSDPLEAVIHFEDSKIFEFFGLPTDNLPTY